VTSGALKLDEEVHMTEAPIRTPRLSRRAPALVALALCAACANGEAARPLRLGDLLAWDRDAGGAPGWIRTGCRETPHPQANRSICGVGSMTSARSTTRARETAISRARTEVARSLQTRVEAMLADYTGASAEIRRKRTNADQQIVDVSRQITRVSVSGIEVRRTWIADNGTVFVLVSLDVDRFRSSVRHMTDLSAHMRRAIDQRAESAFAAGPTPAPG
jgi:hypothetical protein